MSLRQWLCHGGVWLICFSGVTGMRGALGAPPGDVAALKRLSIEELSEIRVVSVSRQPERLNETPSAIQVITGEDIRRSGASSIPEALRLADNLSVAQKGAATWGISARGFNTELGNKLLVMQDGRTLYSPLFSGVFWERQDYLLEDIERIEVISGPGGTAWGANAVNGVINILTKSAADTQGLYVEGGGGTELRGFGAARYGGELTSNVFYRVYGKYFDRDSAVFSNGTSAGDSWFMGQGGFRVDALPAAASSYTLQGDFYGGDQNVTTGGTRRNTGGNILGRWTHTFSDESELSLQLYYDWTHLRLPTQPLIVNNTVVAPAGTLEDDLDTYDLDFQHRFRLGERNRVIWGLGYRFTRDVTKNAPGVGFLPPVQNQHLYSGFLQNETKLVENVFLTLGSKVEHTEYTGWEFEPSARLHWQITSNQMVWAAVSRAVRMPSRLERDISQAVPPNPVLLAGNSSFHSESVIAYELGYRTQLSQRFLASAAAFYNDYHDIRSLSTTPGTGFPFYFANYVEGVTYGVELTGRYQLTDWWLLHAGYRLLLEDLRVQRGRSDFGAARSETADPQQQFSVRSSFTLPQNVELDAGLRWVDTLHNNSGPTPGKVPSYFELRLRLGWRPTPWLELAIVGQNLLHDRHPEFGFPTVNRVEIERSVYGKVVCRF